MSDATYLECKIKEFRNETNVKLDKIINVLDYLCIALTGQRLDLMEFEQPGSNMLLIDVPVSSFFAFSGRVRAVLARAGIAKVGELMAMTQQQVLDIPGCGQYTLSVIAKTLAAHNASLKDVEVVFTDGVSKLVAKQDK